MKNNKTLARKLFNEIVIRTKAFAEYNPDNHIPTLFKQLISCYDGIYTIMITLRPIGRTQKTISFNYSITNEMIDNIPEDLIIKDFENKILKKIWEIIK